MADLEEPGALISIFGPHPDGATWTSPDKNVTMLRILNNGLSIPYHPQLLFALMNESWEPQDGSTVRPSHREPVQVLKRFKRIF